MKLALVAYALSASACLIPSDSVPHSERNYGLSARQARPEPDFPIGTGDRFNKGKVAPKGLSTSDRNLKSILTPAEVNSALEGLAKQFKEVELIHPPHKTYEGFKTVGAKIGKNPKFFIISGAHARERGGPDNVVYWLSDLLHARKAGKGLKYGKTTYTAAEVRKALDGGIVILPNINPDGVKYDQKTNSCWRKNRNPKSSKGNPDAVGIDINRNYDFLFNYKKAFSDSIDLSSVASEDPTSEVFHGTGPNSEPETKNVVWTMDKFKSLSWFVDLHSFGGYMLYAWGDDDAQTSNKAESFANKKYDGRRGVLGDAETPKTKYKEYITKSDLTGQLKLGNRMKQVMENAGTSKYTVQEAVGLYPTSGASTDYALARYYGKACGKSKLQSYTIEFGEESGSAACPFYPDQKQYHMWMKQVAAGLTEVALKAADTTPDVKKCPY
ncbi:carboxypeptidase a4 [Fusarium langsethiae]|uniref:Carboxypeptidase a4 n=1 Tax=Fusarium langsethiae TaxID=179993 RepID=A0A0M9EVR6_FUSLA|nr:carboxypeptidase a4 [Fusarium langsethiae]GKU02953.1 unnamed protein product [Fusarium langsethiae]GKU19928.1 unnamed protein product [Fusarium langsethiae]